MYMQTIHKFLQQKKQVSIFLVYSMSAIWVFDHIENKHTLYREEDYMKRFEKKFENLEKKKMLP